MHSSHPWKLVGPWYRWHAPDRIAWPAPLPDSDGIGGQLPLGRSSRPVLQKYAAPDFVEQFLKDPQRSLRYDASDLVYAVAANGSTRTATSVRKVFLNTHQRFYLVVCELHCDVAGFPHVDRRQVCEAGFVVRRRRVPVPEPARGQVEAALASLARARFQRQQVLRRTEPPAGNGPIRTTRLEALRATRERELAKAESRLCAARQTWQAVVEEFQLQPQVEGWRPLDAETGRWQTTEELPDEIWCRSSAAPLERIHPLYPLLPDPASDDHSSEGRSLWFGVLPTASAEQDAAGNPRFDDRHVLEVRCFVRRHRPPCLVTRQPNDCGGELVWSAASEPFQLAAPFDLDGTSHRVTTIRLPDLRDLQAQVSSPTFQPGQAAGVAMVTPAGSELNFSVDEDGRPVSQGVGQSPSVCFFAIPLITIVATFLLRLFLPIVVFLFQLWYLLLLKFCIPPAFSLGDLAAQLDADLDFQLDADLALNAQLRADIEASFDQLGAGPAAEMRKQLQQGTITHAAAAQLALDQGADLSGSLPEDLSGQVPPPEHPGRVRQRPVRPLVYYERIRAQVSV
ncbi:MAG: hypothetical protein J5I93_20815 [Pirellulaceae bacterium]|nr:hypothetical protein [Pirellulaceae bacterium]